MRILIIFLLGFLLVGCGGAVADLPTETPTQPAAPTETLPPPTTAPAPTPAPSTAKSFSDLMEQGAAYFDQGDLEQAMLAYKGAVLLEPEDAAAHNSLGIVYGLSGMLDQAVAELLEAIRLDPDNGAAHSNLCQVYRRQGRIKEALAECQEAIRLGPGLAEAHLNLGLVYFEQEKLDLALEEFQETIRLDPELTSPYMNAGVVYAKTGRSKEALDVFEEVVRIDPDYGRGHYNLGNVYYDLGQTEQAIAEWQRAIDLEPEFADSHLNLGTAYKELGRTQEALAELETYLELDPNSAQRERVEADIAALGAPQAGLGAEYVDAFGGYRLNHPADWAAQLQNEPGMVLLGADAADPNPFVLILAKALSFFADKLNLEELTTASEFAAAVAPQYKIDPQTLEASTVAGMEAMSGPWHGTDASSETLGRIFFFVNGGTGYVLVYSANSDQLASFEPTAQAMLDSFTFVEPVVSVAYSDPTAGYELHYPEGWTAEKDELNTKFTPQPDLEPNDAPYVAFIAGQDDIAYSFQIEGDLTSMAIIDAFARLTQAQVAKQNAIMLGGEQATPVEVQVEIDGVRVQGLLLVLDPATRPLVVLGLAPFSQWEAFAPTFVAMMRSVVLGAATPAGAVDFSDPAAVVQAVFDAAASQDFSVLSSLCDPMGENDEDTAMVCAITADHASRDSFVEYFSKGKLVSEGEIHAGRYEVPFLVGPNGDQAETMILIQRDGKWYLFDF